MPPNPLTTTPGAGSQAHQGGAVAFTYRTLLVQALCCVLPSAGLLAMGKATLAGYCFWALLGTLLVVKMAMGRRDEVLCVILAVSPFINLLRVFAFYNVILFLLIAGVLSYYVMAPAVVRKTRQVFGLINSLFACCFVYYALTLYNTHDYSTNLRVFELVFTIAFILLLGRNPACLGAALTGVILSACLVGLSMLPLIQAGKLARLGVIQIEGQVLGNPTQLGIPLAFGVLALMVDRGRWLALASHPLCRLLMLVATLPLLALTTSRSAWLVALGGIVACMLLGSRQRLKMIAGAVIGLLAFQAVLLSPLGYALQKGLNRTFGETRTARQRTSGRSDQWKVAYHAFTKTTRTMVCGYGPGTGSMVYAKCSREVEDVKYAVGKKVLWHSLFMQIGVEAGVVGLALLAGWLAIVFARIVKHMRGSGVLFPLICFLSYVFIVITVSGSDTNSGIFLGIAMLGTTDLEKLKESIQSRIPRWKIALADAGIRHQAMQ